MRTLFRHCPWARGSSLTSSPSLTHLHTGSLVSKSSSDTRSAPCSSTSTPAVGSGVVDGIKKTKTPPPQRRVIVPHVVNNLPTESELHFGQGPLRRYSDHNGPISTIAEGQQSHLFKPHRLESLHAEDLKSYLLKAYDDAFNYCKCEWDNLFRK